MVLEFTKGVNRMYSSFEHLRSEVSQKLIYEYGGTGYHVDRKGKKISVNFLGNDYLFHVTDFILESDSKVNVIDDIFNWELERVITHHYESVSIDNVQELLVNIWTKEKKGRTDLLA